MRKTDDDSSSSKRKYDGGTAGSTSTITIWKILVTRAHFHVLLLLQRRRGRRTTMTSVGDHRTACIRPCVVACLFRDEKDSAAAFCPPGIRPRLRSTVGRLRRTWSRRQWRASVPFGLHFLAMKGNLVLRNPVLVLTLLLRTRSKNRFSQEPDYHTLFLEPQQKFK